MSVRDFRGLGVCEGIAFGRVHLVDRRRVTVPHYHIPEAQRSIEVGRFEDAVRISETQLEELQERAGQNGLSQVESLLRAHGMILHDAALRNATRDRIEKEGQNAEWALKDTVKHLKSLFDRLDHDYFRERRSDIDIVGDRLMRNLVGAETELLNNISEDAVVVAYDLSPADAVALAKFKARAFVTESGGPTSHTAILARALDVPCVLNVHGVMDVAGFGDEIVVDGRTGHIVLRPSTEESSRFRNLELRRRRQTEALMADRELPAETLDGVRIELMGNIEVSQEIDSVLRYGGEGVGLYRTEFLYIERPDLAGGDQHFDAYAKVVRSLDGRRITIRTVDIGGDKFLRRSTDDDSPPRLPSLHLVPPRGENPALSLRAIRLSLREPAPFREQLEGILRAAALGPVRLLIPFVTTLDEIRCTRGLLNEVRQSLERRRIPHASDIEVGIMVETPATAWIADLFCKEVDFLAIGTNDLIQYTLATDRANEDVAYLYRPCHPAVLRTLKYVVAAAEPYRTPISLCGEMGSEPFQIPLLIGLGLHSLSMSARAIPVVKRMIRRLNALECKKFVDEALAMSTADEVERALADRLQDWTPSLFGTQA